MRISATIQAPSDAGYAHIADFRRWGAWSRELPRSPMGSTRIAGAAPGRRVRIAAPA